MTINRKAANKSENHHARAAFQALFVTFLWSTSWVLIKIGLKANLPPITFAGLRYTLAFFFLFIFITAINREYLSAIRELSVKTWGELILLGVLFYAITQGAQFVSLASLPAATLTLLLNLTSILIAIYNKMTGKEQPSFFQWGGIFLSVFGAMVYFLPIAIEKGQIPGLIAGLIGLTANAASAIYGRHINSRGNLTPVVVTTISMGVGGLIMLVTGGITQGFGSLNNQQWTIIFWLALINTAFAFTLWNKTLQTLTAVESSIINGTMLPQIAILAWLFLGEPLNTKQIIGMILVGIGTLIVQIRKWQIPLKTPIS